jgi:acyl-CoA synthetase (AMP-forming)/AMP-acid ligase II
MAAESECSPLGSKPFPNVKTRNFFGLTETPSVTHVLPAPDAVSRPDSVGKALPDIGVMITDEAGQRSCGASHKVPQIVEFRSELLRNLSGNALKRELR